MGKYYTAKPQHLIAFCISLVLLSCNPDDDLISHPNEYTIPTTYNFENVSFSGQTTRLNMFSELKSYMASSKTSGVSIDPNKLVGMYKNDPATASWSNNYDSSKQLKSKTFESVQADFEKLLTDLAASSESMVPGEEGIDGVIESNDGNNQYLINAQGLDEAQVFEKGLMGACLYYQATSVYMGVDRMDVDNETVIDGEGTEMEHHWDEAFGYFGVPINFPTDKDGIVFWGNYADKRDDLLNSNQELMTALLTGRAAISNKDLTTRDEAIAEARTSWEKISVGSALHYLNGGIENFNDKALALHGLSEAIGFIYSLKFNESRGLEITEIDELLIELCGSTEFPEMNLYNTTVEDIISVRNSLAAYFNFTDIQEQF